MGRDNNGYRNKTLEIGLKVLTAYTRHESPAAADEVDLRKITRDTFTPVDEPARQVTQAELSKLRSKT